MEICMNKPTGGSLGTKHPDLYTSFVILDLYLDAFQIPLVEEIIFAEKADIFLHFEHWQQKLVGEMVKWSDVGT